MRTSDIKQRKTRLSCEADSLTVMEDMMGDMFDDDEEFDMSELVEGFTSADASTSDLLNQLLGITRKLKKNKNKSAHNMNIRPQCLYYIYHYCLNKCISF